MNSKRSMNLFLILTAGAMLFVGGCRSAPTIDTKPVPEVLPVSLVQYIPDDRVLRQMTPQIAYRTLVEVVHAHPLRLEEARMKEAMAISAVQWIDNMVLMFVLTDGWSISVPLGGISVEMTRDQNHPDNANVNINSTTIGVFRDIPAKQFADALFVLKQAAIHEPARREKARFEEAAYLYRKSAVKPALPEEARRFGIQAVSAIREKKFTEAADLYKNALDIAPWWPAGHFDRSMVLGEIGDFQTAIFEMKRYLQLVPDAPNSRAGQDKIYEWERNISKKN